MYVCVDMLRNSDLYGMCACLYFRELLNHLDDMCVYLYLGNCAETLGPVLKHLACMSVFHAKTLGVHVCVSGTCAKTLGVHVCVSGTCAKTLGVHVCVSGTCAKTLGVHVCVSGNSAETSGGACDPEQHDPGGHHALLHHSESSYTPCTH